MKDLIFGISGVRGIVGKSLTPKVANNLGKAFGTFIYNKKSSSKLRGLKVAVGKDTRNSGEQLKKSFIEGVVSTGCNVIDMGELATPALLFNVVKTRTHSGAIITASHNPPEWNGIKFAGPRGMFIGANEIEEIYNFYNDESFIKTVEGKIIVDTNAEKRHITTIIDSLNRDAIRSCRFKIAIDSPWFGESSRLLRSLGCEVFEVISSRDSNPLPENLSELSRTVISAHADIGFATDADGDRLVIVTETGEILDSEYTLPLVAKWVLKRRQGLVVTNLSTSKMIEDVVIKKGNRLSRTKVGEVNVVSAMLDGGAILGGEGNGGVIDPFIHYTRDSFVSMCRVLELMASSGKKINALVSELPKYYMRKEQIEDLEIRRLEDFIIKQFPKGKINREDGLHIDFGDGFLHIRKSNTEPIIRVIVETKDKKLTNSLINNILKQVKRCAV